MDAKVKLKIVGISYSEIRSNAYALILAEENGVYHIPIIIGPAEAQSIALKIEKVNMPRPLTHDLIVNINNAFGIKLKEVYIYRFEDGIFSSELILDDGTREITIDSRTSDAIAIAMRTQTPIYTTREIINETGFIMEVNNDKSLTLEKKSADVKDSEVILENLTIEELEKRLNHHIEYEEYEEAAKISALIKEKNNNSNKSIS